MTYLLGECRKQGFTLIELMIAVLIIGMLLSIAIPAYTKARSSTRLKACVQSMRQIETAKDQYAIEARKVQGDPVVFNDIVPVYIRSVPECPAGGTYTVGAIGTQADCDFAGHDL